MPMPILDDVRDAIERSGETRYRIAQGSGVSEAQLSRVVHGEQGMNLTTLERLLDYLGLEVVIRPKRGRAKRKERK